IQAASYLEINETSTAGITPRSSDGRLIRSAKLIVIDEISMVTKSVLKMGEAALRDVCDDNRPFEHKVVVCAGDFRQTLPVIVGANRDTIVDECVKTSLNHFHFVRHNLLHNVRAEQDQQDFFRWLLELENRTLPPFRQTPYGNLIQIPEQCIETWTLSSSPIKLFCLRSTLHATKSTTRQSRDYLAFRKHIYSLTPSGFPPHRLILKVGAVAVLPRNLNLRQSLCNGTRLLIHVLGSRYIDAERIDSSGRLTGER
ncbi:hypothetical protein NQ318_003681, partial [Aromia moschata]